MTAAKELAPTVGVEAACKALKVARGTYYRHQKPKPLKRPPRSARAISPDEKRKIIDTPSSEPFADKAPKTIYATLLDQNIYLCSPRSMYRFLAEKQMVRERRNQLRRPNHAAPELMATGPNQLWSWDITKLRGNAPYLYYYLYTMLDVFSRFVVGWMVAEREGAGLAKELIKECCARQNIGPSALTIHSDRGAPMIAKPVAALMDQLGVKKSHSRPHVSNDNPFIESHFKTFKYHHQMDSRFGCAQHARQSARVFYDWYNYEHRHSGVGYMIPADVHQGKAQQVLDRRHAVRLQAFRRHPERFLRGAPARLQAPAAVYINPPNSQLLSSSNGGSTQKSEVTSSLIAENPLTARRAHVLELA